LFSGENLLDQIGGKEVQANSSRYVRLVDPVALGQLGDAEILFLHLKPPMSAKAEQAYQMWLWLRGSSRSSVWLDDANDLAAPAELGIDLQERVWRRSDLQIDR
jgi:hypothetical protein